MGFIFIFIIIISSTIVKKCTIFLRQWNTTCIHSLRQGMQGVDIFLPLNFLLFHLTHSLKQVEDG